MEKDNSREIGQTWDGKKFAYNVECGREGLKFERFCFIAISLLNIQRAQY